MQGLDWLIWVACFVTGTFFVYGVLHYTGSRRMVKDRFKKTTAKVMPIYQRESGGKRMKRLLDWVSSCGKFATKDKENTYKLRLSLIQAGFRHPKGTAIYFGFQALGAFFLPLPYLLVNAMHGTMTSGNLMICLLLAGGGFYLPQFSLKIITKRRKDRIDRALPDVLDLLIVCMEAGLSLQPTLNRVSEEIRDVCQEFNHELQITAGEMRTGITRDTALRNLGKRTGVESLQSLVTLMIQSEKLGTSLAQSLRAHADFSRVQRTLRAEEMAQKLPVKIVVPLVFFILPAMFIVIIGPGAIQMGKTLIPLLYGTSI